MMKEQEFADLSTREDVLNQFGLSEDWQDDNRVAEVTIGTGENQGLRVEMSTAGPIEDTAAGLTRPGGGTQHHALEFVEG